MRVPDTWITTRLGEICALNPPLLESEKPAPADMVTFVPMAAVDEVRGEIVAP